MGWTAERERQLAVARGSWANDPSHDGSANKGSNGSGAALGEDRDVAEEINGTAVPPRPSLRVGTKDTNE